LIAAGYGPIRAERGFVKSIGALGRAREASYAGLSVTSLPDEKWDTHLGMVFIIQAQTPDVVAGFSIDWR